MSAPMRRGGCREALVRKKHRRALSGVPDVGGRVGRHGDGWCGDTKRRNPRPRRRPPHDELYDQVQGRQDRALVLTLAGSAGCGAAEAVIATRNSLFAVEGVVFCMRTFLCLALAFLLGPLLAPATRAADYPERPIKLFIPLAAASAVDVVARMVGDKMGAILGQPIYVE